MNKRPKANHPWKNTPPQTITVGKIELTKFYSSSCRNEWWDKLVIKPKRKKNEKRDTPQPKNKEVDKQKNTSCS